MPSRLLLPVVPGVSAPTGLPPCPGLRGEPCRDYQTRSRRRIRGDGKRNPGSSQSGWLTKKCKKRSAASPRTPPARSAGS